MKCKGNVLLITNLNALYFKVKTNNGTQVEMKVHITSTCGNSLRGGGGGLESKSLFLTFTIFLLCSESRKTEEKVGGGGRGET